MYSSEKYAKDIIIYYTFIMKSIDTATYVSGFLYIKLSLKQ